MKLGGMLQILDWVKDFCTKTGASGQLCFDFMRDSNDGRMYAFECNPRTSTILLNFYNHDHVAQAFFNAKVLPAELPHMCLRFRSHCCVCGEVWNPECWQTAPYTSISLGQSLPTLPLCPKQTGSEAQATLAQQHSA